jgi:E3 ubiquitin-protein ligase BIG BROTHER-like protein
MSRGRKTNYVFPGEGRLTNDDENRIGSTSRGRGSRGGRRGGRYTSQIHEISDYEFAQQIQNAERNYMPQYKTFYPHNNNVNNSISGEALSKPDPKILDLYTREIDSNDYAILSSLDANNVISSEDKGLTTAELKLLPTFKFNNKRKYEDHNDKIIKENGHMKSSKIIKLYDDSQMKLKKNIINSPEYIIIDDDNYNKEEITKSKVSNNDCIFIGCSNSNNTFSNRLNRNKNSSSSSKNNNINSNSSSYNINRDNYLDIIDIENNSKEIVISSSNSTEELTQDEQCQICLEPYIANETLTRLPCFHIYHKNCINKWLKDNNSCPIDKLKVF